MTKEELATGKKKFGGTKFLSHHLRSHAFATLAVSMQTGEGNYNRREGERGYRLITEGAGTQHGGKTKDVVERTAQVHSRASWFSSTQA